MRRASALLAAMLMVLTGTVTGAPPPASAGPAPALRDPHPCAEVPGFTCSTMRVPLDRGGRVHGTLDLDVATDDQTDAPRGVLLLLTGGPGQPGVGLLPRVLEYIDPRVREEYRLVVFDQRGTGPDGIDCPELQASVGGSDFRTPSAAAVRACARQLGVTRNFYRTSDTVGDIDQLRRALGVHRLTLDGVSYGTFTAEHYALTHPGRVRRLVLDSVVPHVGYDTFPLAEMRATARVLRDACRDDPACTTDPVADLAWVVRHVRIDGERVGSRLLDTLAILSLSTIDPGFHGIPGVLHDARNGDTADLADLLAQASSVGQPAEDLSAGLHMATTCADERFPWGDSSAPLAGREAALDRAASELDRSDVWPYDVATARRALPVAGCLVWPPAKPNREPRLDVLPMRTLLVQGERDLFCPVWWARWEADRAPRGRLVVVPDGGHGVQGKAGQGRDAVTRFLLA